VKRLKTLLATVATIAERWRQMLAFSDWSRAEKMKNVSHVFTGPYNNCGSSF
jgi:hypothetical protein